ncbi:MAG: YdbL family protein [Aquimonas sp.]|jgi:uncharacterized protein YdbL (DUF1318 family)
MLKPWNLFAAAVLLSLSACVTINVYFPAAEAQQAAREFVENVIGEQPKVESKPEAGQGGGMAALGSAVLDFVFPSAQAQSVDINIRTPAIQAIQSRMAERFQSSLASHFDSGALGLARDGTISLRDASKVGLRERAAVNQAVADDNRDRNAVYREIAVANGHPEWEAQIRDTFARQWIESARSGWWYQDAAGTWTQK